MGKKIFGAPPASRAAAMGSQIGAGIGQGLAAGMARGIEKKDELEKEKREEQKAERNALKNLLPYLIQMKQARIGGKDGDPNTITVGEGANKRTFTISQAVLDAQDKLAEAKTREIEQDLGELPRNKIAIKNLASKEATDVMVQALKDGEPYEKASQLYDATYKKTYERGLITYGYLGEDTKEINSKDITNKHHIVATDVDSKGKPTGTVLVRDIMDPEAIGAPTKSKEVDKISQVFNLGPAEDKIRRARGDFEPKDRQIQPKKEMWKPSGKAATVGGLGALLTSGYSIPAIQGFLAAISPTASIAAPTTKMSLMGLGAGKNLVAGATALASNPVTWPAVGHFAGRAVGRNAPATATSPFQGQFPAEGNESLDTHMQRLFQQYYMGQHAQQGRYDDATRLGVNPQAELERSPISRPGYLY